jgi:hypothetical protein
MFNSGGEGWRFSSYILATSKPAAAYLLPLHCPGLNGLFVHILQKNSLKISD